MCPWSCKLGTTYISGPSMKCGDLVIVELWSMSGQRNEMVHSCSKTLFYGQGIRWCEYDWSFWPYCYGVDKVLLSLKKLRTYWPCSLLIVHICWWRSLLAKIITFYMLLMPDFSKSNIHPLFLVQSSFSFELILFGVWHLAPNYHQRIRVTWCLQYIS